MANKITTVFDAETRGFTTGMKNVKKSVGEANGALGKMRAGIKSGIAEFKASNTQQAAVIAGLGAAAFKSIGLASDLEESTNAVRVTFGEAADEVLKIGENSAKSFGLSKSEFNDLAVQFSAFAKQATGPGGDVAATIQDMATRTADFASVMNLDLATATQVFQSSLAGQTEPIRRYGKDLSAAAVEQFALTNGLIETKSELTETIKVQARYGLLMQETADTAGDFTNTSDSLANSQRILAAEAKDLATGLGEDLAPALGAVIQGMQSLVTVAETLHLDEALGFLNEIGPAAEDFGHSLRGVVDSTAAANFAIADEFERSNDVVAGFDKTLLDNAGSFEEARAIVLDNVKGMEDWADTTFIANSVALEWQKANEDAAAAVELSTEAIEDAERATADAKHENALANTELKKLNTRYDDLGPAIAEVEAETVDYTEALRDLVAELDDANSSTFDYEKATINLGSAVGDLAGKVGDELRLAQIGAAEDALAAAAAFAEQSGASAGTTEFARLQREELERLRAKFPELTDDIDRYILTLLRIPTDITTAFHVTGQQVTRGGDIIGQRGGKRAHGGPTQSGGLYEVNEQGSELLHEGGRTYLMAGANGQVEPLSSTGGSAGKGSGGVTINVYPKTGDVAPAAIVKALKQYERFNGTGWRS